MIQFPTKKVLPLLLILFTLVQGAAIAQSQNIDAGIKALEEHKYETAMAELNTGLSEPDKLKSKMLTKAYFHRAKARMARLNILRGNPGLSKELQGYSAGLIEDLEQTEKLDGGGKYTEELNVMRKNAKALLQELAKQTLIVASDKNLTDAERNAKCDEVADFCTAAIALDKFDYSSYRMNGKGELIRGDSTQALIHYRTADAEFSRSAPKTGDLSIGYMYILIAELELQVNNDPKAAKEAVEEGKDRLSGEYSKVKRLNLRPNELADKTIRYNDAQKDLDRMAGSLAARSKMGK